MEAPEIAAFDDSRITPESRRFAAELFGRFPELRHLAFIQRYSEERPWTLVVKASAPSRDPRSELVIWVDEGIDPSIAFGDWHTHQSLLRFGIPDGAEREAFLDLIAGIFADQIVICESIESPANGIATILDMSRPDALLDELTARHAPARIRLRSWTGIHDREASLDDPALESPTHD